MPRTGAHQPANIFSMRQLPELCESCKRQIAALETYVTPLPCLPRSALDGAWVSPICERDLIASMAS